MRHFVNRLLVGMVVLMAFLFITQAFTQSPPDKYQYGNRSSVTLTSADTIDISPNNLTFTYATLSIDTNVVVNVDVDESIIGDRIVLEVTADATNRHLTFNNNITAVADSVVATKTKLFEFVYNGTGYKEVAEMAVD